MCQNVITIPTRLFTKTTEENKNLGKWIVKAAVLDLKTHLLGVGLGFISKICYLIRDPFRSGLKNRYPESLDPNSDSDFTDSKELDTDPNSKIIGPDIRI